MGTHIFMGIYITSIFIYISLYIRHRAARHARACSIHCLVVWFSCFLVSFRGPHPQNSNSPWLLFSSFFASFFQTCFFTTTGAKRCQNGSFKRPHNRTNLEKLLIKTHSWSRLAKRLRLEGPNLWIWRQLHTFSCFFRGPGLRKWSRNGTKMEPPGTQNHKKSKKVGTQKNIKKQDCEKWVRGRILTSKRESFFAPETFPKSQKSEISSKWVPRPPKWALGPLK